MLTVSIWHFDPIQTPGKVLQPLPLLESILGLNTGETKMRPSICSALIVAYLAVVSVEAAPRWPLPEGIKSVEVNGYEMAYREAGSGTPIVLVHGSVNDYRTWNAQVPVFAEKYRVFGLSLRHYYPEPWEGHGDDFSLDQHASDVAAFIEKLNLGKVHLLGHSRGGDVVLRVANEHPELIKTLILEDASGLDKLLPDSADSQGRTEAYVALARNLATGNRELAAQAYFDISQGPGTWVKRPPEEKKLFLDNVGTVLKPEARKPVTTCEQIARYDFPILLLTAERSPRRYGQAFAAMRKCKNIPEPIMIPNAGHPMNRDNPAAFNAAVLDFLAHNE
jgi:pimeloyl-ACP methyl ester carboxylesterase